MADRSIHLGIDFGTSTTVAVIAQDGREPRPLLFDGSPLLPSAVCVDPTGRLVIGRDAVHLGVATPAGFEPHPKRCVDEGTVLLAGTEVAVEVMFDAVLRRVAEEAARIGDGPPDEIVITHPAAWGTGRKAVLQRAAPPNTQLVPEPVAAAHYFVEVAGHQVPDGKTAIVYDFGAGTFDASLVRRTGKGFAVLAAKGLPDSGGLDIDAAVVEYLRTIVVGDEIWARLTAPADLGDRRASRQLWDNVRTAKEMLSRSAQTLVHLPLFDVEAPLGREQIEELAAPILERTVQTTRDLLASAGVGVADVAAVFLAGGSSRMPAVATALHRALGIAPSIVDAPELVVAEGSLRATAPPPLDEAWPAVDPVPVAPPTPRRARLLVAAGVVLAVLLAGGTAVFGALNRGGDDKAGITTNGASPSPTYPPGIDPCLLGTWRVVISHSYGRIDNDDRVLYTGGAGTVATYREDGTSTVDFNSSQPSVAHYFGATWVDTVRGTSTADYYADGKAIRWSNIRPQGQTVLTRNGKYNNGGPLTMNIDASQYVCSEKELRVWAERENSTAERISPQLSKSPSG